VERICTVGDGLAEAELALAAAGSPPDGGAAVCGGSGVD